MIIVARWIKLYDSVKDSGLIVPLKKVFRNTHVYNKPSKHVTQAIHAKKRILEQYAALAGIMGELEENVAKKLLEMETAESEREEAKTLVFTADAEQLEARWKKLLSEVVDDQAQYDMEVNDYSCFKGGLRWPRPLWP